MNEETVNNAMQIILCAGDARLRCKEALDCVAKFDFENAKLKLKKAYEEITKAHKIQTDVIQGEAQGKESKYSLLFAHAQDTLMTIYSELNIAKQMISIFESYECRIRNLEEKE